MRPIRLEIEGFTSFRDRAVVDFAGADLFAFVGPTGAGKSSLIDGMVFALFGNVPRYGDARLVGSVVNQRSARALVDFEFSIGDDAYRIVREVRRQKSGGGATREARLERAATGEALFDGDAKQLTAEVESLLGLTREQFTKCVVLPQGDFQRFLHDKPGVRQDLLVQLLGIEIYGRVGELARQRQKAEAARVEALDDQLRDLETRLASAPALRERRQALGRLQAAVDELMPGLEEAASAAAAVQQDLDQIGRQLAKLQQVQRPEGLDDLAEAVAELDEELVALAQSEEERAAEAQAAVAARAELPPLEVIKSAGERQGRRAELAERVAKGERLLEQTAGEVDRAESVFAQARATVVEAEASLEHIQREQAAAHLASGLHEGDECPVCHRALDQLPEHDVADLDAATRTLASCRDEAERAGAEREAAKSTRQSYESKLQLLREQLAELGPSSDDPPRDQIDETLRRIVAAEEAVESSRLVLRAARERREASEQKRRKLAKIETSAWDEFDTARDLVAVLEPPKVMRGDLTRSWSTLVDFVDHRRLELNARQSEGRASLEKIQRGREVAQTALEAAFTDADVPMPPSGCREAVAAEIARADVQIERLDESQAAAEQRSGERDVALAAEQVAGELGNLMKSNAFEKWLLDAAMQALVAGGSDKLEELSQGQYSMVVDSKSGAFLVIDHHNADEARSARTLSGGETFLASLALALALAEQVADLASDGAPRIESIFLDEGFGTLDADTLEVVVAAIEELQAGGLMVGLVSHVAELAERVPTRFVVRKDVDGSNIERVDR